MRHLARAIVASFALTLATGAWPDTASSCSCAAIDLVTLRAKEWTDAMFEGTVTKLRIERYWARDFRVLIREAPLSGNSTGFDDISTNYYVVATIEVERVWKGEPGTVIEVATANGSSNCGVDFQIGERYFVVTALDPEVGAVTSACHMTDRASAMREEIEGLGAPTSEPVNARHEAIRRRLDASSKPVIRGR